MKSVKRILSCAIVLVIVFNICYSENASVVSAQVSSNWSQFHGDAAHNGYSLSTGPVDPEEIWTYSLDGSNDGLIAVGNLLLASSPGGKVLALLKTNGTSKYILESRVNWSKSGFIPAVTQASYLTAGDGLIFSATSTLLASEVLYLNANYQDSGIILWASDNIGNVMPDSPVYGQGMLSFYKGHIFACAFRSENLIALDSSKDIIWQLKSPGQIDTIPTVGDNTIVLGFYDRNQITAVSTESNTTLWDFQTDGTVKGTPAFSDGCFYFGTKNGTVYSVSSNGNKNWSTQLNSSIETTPAIAFDSVFIGTSDGTLYALNSETGQIKWQQQIGTEALISPAVVSSNEFLYQATISGKLYAFNAITGDLHWTLPLSSGVTASPVLDGGWLFLIDSTGMVHAIAEKGTIKPTPKPTLWTTTPSPVISTLKPTPSNSQIINTPNNNENPKNDPTITYNFEFFTIVSCITGIVAVVLAYIGLVFAYPAYKNRKKS